MMKINSNIKTIRAMSVPIALMLCRIAKIRIIVNELVKWKEENSKISPGFLIETLVVCVLCERKPLWKVEEFWRKQDFKNLFSEIADPSQLNDDAYGRALEKLCAINMELMISLVSLTMLKSHDLSISFIHLDTTSKSVQGVYEVEGDRDFELCHGFSKDLRPDLKQFKIGLAVNEHKVPVMGQILSGNVSDMKFNPQAAVEMKDFFEKKQYRDIIFVSDCAIVSTESLGTLAQKHVRFISRLPETFSLAEKLKEEALRSENWTKVNDEYQIFATKDKLDGRDYRFLVVQSSHLEAKKEKTLQKQVDKKKAKYEQEAKKLAKQTFACEADALTALHQLSKRVQEAGFPLNATVQREELKSYGQKGRPHKNEEAKVTIVYKIESIVVGQMSLEMLEDIKRKESTFILITNVLNKEKYDDERILKEYKHQNSVENRFKFLKDPVYFGPMFLKNPQRLQALGYVFILALLVASYLEYRVRENLKKNGEAVLLPGKKKTNVPSIATILEILDTIQIVIIGGERFFPDNIDKQALKMIEWAGFEPTIYLQPLAWDAF